MNALRWLALLCLSVSWLFLLPLYAPPSLCIGVALVLIAIVLLAVSIEPKLNQPGAASSPIWLAVPLVPSLFFISFPLVIGPATLLTGILVSAVFRRPREKEVTRRITSAFLTVGCVLVLQAGALLVYAVVFSRLRMVPMASHIVATLSRLIGLESTVSTGTIYLSTHEVTLPFILTWEKLGILPLGLFLVAGLAFIGRHGSSDGRRAGRASLFVLLLAVYGLLRSTALMYAYSVTRSLDVFWRPTYVLFSLLPLAPLLGWLGQAPQDSSILQTRFSCFSKRHLLIGMATALCVFFLAGSKLFQDPGTSKPGSILVDELHSDWEKTSRPLDKEWYGNLSTYNYYSMFEWLDHYYDVDRNEEAILSTQLLEAYDILIAKCPTNAYSEDEIRDVGAFVENGGGLWLIGDHTNVFGMNTYLNQLGREFGIHFNNDSTHELLTRGLSVYRPPHLLAHPAVKDVEEFKFLTSCSLDVPWRAEEVILGHGLGSKPGDYSDKDFFRQITYELGDSDFGAFIQAAAVKHGQGRVVAFTDSTCFSSFSVFMDGNPELILGTVEYLNRENRLAFLNLAFGILGAAFGLFLVILYRQSRPRASLVLLVAFGLLGFVAAAGAFALVRDRAYPLPIPHTDLARIAFDEEHSSAIVSSAPNLAVKRYRTYNTFFVWTQRLELHPFQAQSLEDALPDSEVVVIVNPNVSFTDRERQALVEYVEEGGRLLLMDSLLNTSSTANEIAALFGMGIQCRIWSSKLTLSAEDGGFPEVEVAPEAMPGEGVTASETATESHSADGEIPRPEPMSAYADLYIYGGTLVASSTEGSAKIAVAWHGDGLVAVLVDSVVFSDETMLGTMAEPDEFRLGVFELEYTLFEDLLGVR